MPPRELHPADRVRLSHVLSAARQALEFARGRSRADLDSEPMFRRAVVHCIQEIGEASARVSNETRVLASGVPWAQIVGMRHGSFTRTSPSMRTWYGKCFSVT